MDASKAGYGNLEIAITDVHGNIIPSEVVQQTDAVSKFLVSFQPAEPGAFSVNISFNQEQLNGERVLISSCATSQDHHSCAIVSVRRRPH